MFPGSSRHLSEKTEVADQTALGRLAEMGSGFPNLQGARAYTEASLEAKRRELGTLDNGPDCAVIMFGSWGRGELSGGSDDDWALLVDGPLQEGIDERVSALGNRLGDDERKPGTQGVFGGPVLGDDLIRNIGLEEDRNQNLTRRILLVLESVAITNLELHRRVRDHVLDVYLDQSIKDFRPPRFFLNDLVRYWRTVCVDFVGKERREPDGEKWAIRNAKLRTSRKMLFASGLLPVLLASRFNRAQIRGYLREQFSALPSDRVAEAFLDFGAVDAGLRTFRAYDRWLGILSDAELRLELEALPREDAPNSRLFRDVTRLAEELEGGLLTLLFDTELYPQVRDFGIF